MWLVLSEPTDLSAAWAYKGLKQRGLTPLHLVTPQQLVYSLRNEHHVSTDGVYLEITLADGMTLDSRALSGVLNRTTVVPTDHLSRASESDFSYAVEEWSALLLSWLACLPNVINAPHPLGLCGHVRHPTEWTYMAQCAGLGTTNGSDDLQLSPTSRSVLTLVLDGSVFGPPIPSEVADACLRLWASSSTRMLGIWLEQDPVRGMVFSGASPAPDMRAGRNKFIEALLQSLTAEQM